MRGCIAKRLASLPFLMLLILVLASLSPTKAADEDPFLTNLALLDDLTGKAVDQILDSLGVAEGDSISVLADGFNEGNGFVGDAFVRNLARRGCSVRLLTDVAPPVDEAPAAPAAKKAAGPDTTAADDDAEEEEQDEGDDGQQVDQDPELEDQEDDLDSMFSDSDPFAPDTTSTSDSTAFGVDQETSEADEAEVTEAEEEDDAAAEDPAEEDQVLPSAPQPVPSGRNYPPGKILEFQVLEFGVTYPQVKRRFFLFGASSIQRLGGVYLQARRIEGPDGEILHVASGRSHHLDRISGRSRLLAEGAGYPFTEPTVPAGQVGRLAEPIVVLGIISSLVYLFYQNQN